ncbi:GHKL domain-containing protein [Blautia marasmi]|nr:GHKL domain-containing protein [Blautia marasmi]
MKSLLYQKFMLAASLHLQLDIDIPLPVTSSGSVEPVDLARLIGIFLDNAIEAADESDNKYLFCGLLQDDDNLIIRLTNSCRMSHIPVEKLYEKNITTKGPGHGIGLSNAKEILAQYPNIMHHTECRDNHFTQEIDIGGLL